MSDDLRVYRKVCARVPTSAGEFQLCLYLNNKDDKEHLALVKGEIDDADQPVLVRIHSECFTGDVLGSQRCDCGQQLHSAIEMISLAGRGLIIYLRQEGRGIGLLSKLRAYNLQDEGVDTVDANLLLGHKIDNRDYRIAVAILQDMGINKVRLLTNNPEKIKALEAGGLKVVERIPLIPEVTKDNLAYLLTKAQRMNHLFKVEPVTEDEQTGDPGQVFGPVDSFYE